MLGQTRLELFRSLHLALLRVGLSLARRRVTSQSPAVSLLLEELVEDTLLVRLDELVGDAHHAEDFRLDILAAFDGVVDGSKGLLVHLLQVNLQTTRGVEATVALVALEVLGFLVGDEDFLVVEVALAVVAPRAVDELLDIGAVALFLVHHGCGDGGSGSGGGGVVGVERGRERGRDGARCEDVREGARRRDEDSSAEGASHSRNLVIAGLPAISYAGD